MKYVERDYMGGEGRVANVAPPTSRGAGQSEFGAARTKLLKFLRDNPGSCAGDAVTVGMHAQTSSARANELLGRNDDFNFKHPGGPWLHDTGRTKKSPYSTRPAAILVVTQAGLDYLEAKGL